MPDEPFEYVEFLFDSRRARDKAFGSEVALFENITTDNSYEILYKAKSSRPTGSRKWYGAPEKLPAIQMVVKLNNGSEITGFYGHGLRQGSRKHVKNAIFTFGSRSNDRGLIDSFKKDLEGQCKSLELKDSQINYIKYPAISDAFSGRISGPIRDVVAVHDFAAGRNVRYNSFDMIFY